MKSSKTELTNSQEYEVDVPENRSTRLRFPTERELARPQALDGPRAPNLFISTTDDTMRMVISCTTSRYV